jgi:hypothetical protein
MLMRLLLLAIIFTACRSGEIACPRVKGVKLNKRPANYRMRMEDHSLSASAKEDDKASARGEMVNRQTRPTKDPATIEQWDCPRPGSKTHLPKAVKDNIKKNRKKFETYYKNRINADTVHTGIPAATLPR